MPASLVGVAIDRSSLVLDSWPVMEWLKNRYPAADDFEDLLVSARLGRTTLLMSSINLGEIYYNCWNEWNEARADSMLERFPILPIRIVHPTQPDVMFAAWIKGRYKVSYADAFAAVLALEQQAPVLTGDSDFLKMQRGSLIDVEWWGA